jgi:hypothetical protein
MEMKKMKNDKRDTNNELDDCDDCGSKNLERVPSKGEVWCNDCGLVHNNQDAEAKDNGAILFGEASHHHAVRNDADRNRNMGGTGPKMRYGSRGVVNPSKYYLLEKIDRSSVRNPHPFAKRVKRNIEKLYGRHALHILEFLVEMSCKPLTAEQEQIRKKQNKSMYRRLGMPKQSICRKVKGIKGSSEEQNAVIIAAAIVELAGEMGLMPKFDRRATMEQAGISPKQIMNARISILKHWKAKVSMEWEELPKRKNADDRREDAVDQAIWHILEGLEMHYTPEELELLSYETEARLGLLNEGTSNAHSINIEARMIVCVTMYASMNYFGWQAGAADILAGVFGLTSSGIRSRYDALVKDSEAGTFHDNGAFDASVACYDPASEIHKKNALISKQRLAKICAKQSSSLES